METDQEMAEAEDFWPAVEKALHPALATLVKMREREAPIWPATWPRAWRS